MDAREESKKILVRVSRDKIRQTELFVEDKKTDDGTILTLSDGLTAGVNPSGTKIMIYNLEVVDDDDSPVEEKTHGREPTAEEKEALRRAYERCNQGQRALDGIDKDDSELLEENEYAPE